jgi:hypothetical protein
MSLPVITITWIGSPNFSPGRGGNAVTIFTPHWMAGYLAGTDATFLTFGAEGRNLHQYVRLTDTPWSNSVFSINQKVISIEFSANVGRDCDDETYESGCWGFAYAAKELGIPVTDGMWHLHKEYLNTQCPGTLDIDRIRRRTKEIWQGMVGQGVDQPIGGGEPAVLSSTKITIFPDAAKYMPNGYPQTTVIRRANVRTRIDRMNDADIVEVLEPGTVQDVDSIVHGIAPKGSTNTMFFHKPNGYYLWTGNTGYTGDGKL